jgi:hypothetical protein
MVPCNFFEHVRPGCRPYLMKSVIHDWDDGQARIVLAKCRSESSPEVGGSQLPAVVSSRD